jgi:hypothetical protein
MPKRRSRVINIPALYSGGPDFKSRSETGYPDRKMFRDFSDSPGECRERNLKLGHDRFLPNPFQLIIQLSPFHSTL